jgi:hypothetical protein
LVYQEIDENNLTSYKNNRNSKIIMAIKQEITYFYWVTKRVTINGNDFLYTEDLGNYYGFGVNNQRIQIGSN